MSRHKVLITGGAGFIGSHLAAELLRTDHTVYVVDDGRASLPRSLAACEPYGIGRFALRTAPVSELANHYESVDTVVHLAATIGVDAVVRDVRRMVKEHAEDIWTVIDYARRAGAKRLLVASSSEVYGTSPFPMRESDWLRVGPTHLERSAYAATKIYAEHAAMWGTPDDLDVAVLRFFNVAGPGQRADDGCVISRWCKALAAGDPIDVHGDGEQVRKYCDVRDVAATLTDLIDTDWSGKEILNIGGGVSMTTSSLAQLVRELAGGEAPQNVVPYSSMPPGTMRSEMQERTPNLYRLRQVLPVDRFTTPLHQTITDTIAYWKERISHVRSNATAAA